MPVSNPKRTQLCHEFDSDGFCNHNIKKNTSKSINSFFDPDNFGLGIKTWAYSVNDLIPILRKAINEIKKERLVKFNFISTPEINQMISKLEKNEDIQI